MKAAPHLNTLRRHRQGVVLIIVLAFVVLLTGLVVAFFSRAMNSRQVSDSSANEARADFLAKSAIGIIVGDLKQEIVAGSTALSGSDNAAWTPSWPTVYTPVSNLTAVPFRSGVPVGAATPIPNLISRSVRPSNTGGPCPYIPYTSGTYTNPPPNRAADDTGNPANVSSVTPSLNGRFISPIRWNSHYLIPCANSTDATPVSSFVPPDWVIVTRAGANSVKWSSNLANPSISNTNYVIGRYAYAVYDEGGLLDANVAGFPSGLTSAQVGQKGSLALADLTALPTSVTGQTYLDQGWIDDIVGWRNYATAQPGGYFDSKESSFIFDSTSATRWLSGFVTSNTSGYLTVSATTAGSPSASDQTFLSRQQLISLSNSLGFSHNVLQYLGTFSRTLTAPSWSPRIDAGNGYTYKTNAESAIMTISGTSAANPNRDLPNVRFPASATITRYHDDGTSYTVTVNAGDPLVQHRFSLARLSWIGPSGPENGGTPQNIQACFGLVWAPSQQNSIQNPNENLSAVKVWQYVGPTGSTERSSIETLDQIAKESPEREPNFFELLQAGILAGSVGVSGHIGGISTDNPEGGDTALACAHQASAPLQILRIGACMINQANTDSYPRIVEYSQSGVAWQAMGVTSLPYIYSCKTLEGLSPDDAPNGAVYIAFGLWNPNQNPTAPTNRPPVRLHVQGSFGITNNWGKYKDPYPSSYPSNYKAGPYKWLADIQGVGYEVTGIDSTINLAATGTTGINGFSESRLIGPNDVSAPPTDPGPDGMGWALTAPPSTPSASGLPGQYVAYRLPDFLITSSTATTVSGTTGSPPPSTWSDSSAMPWSNVAVTFSTDYNDPFQYYLEYQDPAGNWVPYNYATGVNDRATWSGLSTDIPPNTPPHNYKSAVQVGPYWDGVLTPQPPSTPTFPSLLNTFQKHSMVLTSDPRSLRFNTWVYQRNSAAPSSLTGPMWDFNAGNSYFVPAGYGGAAPPPFNPNGPPPGPGIWEPVEYPLTRFGIFYHPAALSRNNTPNSNGNTANWYNTSYSDNDTIQRVGDSGLFTGTYSTTNLQGNPYQRQADRPVILNRPFESVAELGYTFRDDPWRTLDLFSPNSPDAALLDLFSVKDDTLAMEAGHIYLNSHNAPALAAVLKNTIADPIVGTPLAGGTLSTITQLAQDIAKITGTSPLQNVADLVTNVIGSGTSGLSAADFANTDEQNIKARRESIARGLADAGQTRTWNLLIDIVAQSGNYPDNASALNQFVVKGERRYWLHVAVDRITGQVVDQKLEQVSE